MRFSNFRYGAHLLILFLGVGLMRLGHGEETEPFWRSKPRVYDQILNKRRIVVSVRKIAQVDGGKRYRVIGAGVVNAPLERVRTLMGQFERLPSVSDHFKKVVHNEKDKKLMLHLQAVGFETRLFMNYQWRELADGAKQMDWQVTEGPFIGMVGHYQLRPLPGQRTEVSTWTLVLEPKVPIPDFLLNFTLEVIAEKVAQKMRSFLESPHTNKGVQ